MTYAKPPVLSGTGKSDYENYLRTDELLSLQKGPDQWQHRDELLFTVVHQTSELWLKLATSEIEESCVQLEEGNIRETHRLLARVVISVNQVHNALDMLDKMSPVEYQLVRKALGHGSGFDSPGFNHLRISIQRLGCIFDELLAKQNVNLLNLFLNFRSHEDLFELAEWLLEIDERVSLWRLRHLKVIERSIGSRAIGTQGTHVDSLVRLTNFRFFPRLWDIRNEIRQTFEV